MAYAKRYAGGFFDFPNTTTPIDSAFLNALETSMLKLQAVDASADAQVLQFDNANSRFAPALILNKNIDAAAAIAKSKLDFTGANGIVNADVAGAAAVALSKLAATGTIGTSPISIAAAGKTALQIADSGAQLSGFTIGGDANLFRLVAATLKTDGNLQVAGQLSTLFTVGTIGIDQSGFDIAGRVAYQVRFGAEVNPRYKVSGDGTVAWGAGGASATDTTLSRDGATSLAANGQLHVNMGLASANQVWLGQAGGGITAGITLGTDWNIARTGTAQATVMGMLVTQKFSPTQINANLNASVNDWVPTGLATAGSISISGSAAWNITGIDGTQSGQWLALVSISAFNITLKNQDAGSLAANRFACPGAVDFVLAPGHAVLLVYDTVNVRWRIIGS